MNQSKEIKRIFLTGYMGSGKTFMAKALAKQLSWDCEDLDGLIEEAESLSISEIFDSKGEDYFRTLEYDKIAELCKKDNKQLISLGGGAYAQQRIHDYITEDQSSVVVYLKFTADVLAQRLQSEKDKRPLIKDVPKLEEFIENHLKERSAYYEKADLIIFNEQNPIGVINQVISYLLYRNQKSSTT